MSLNLGWDYPPGVTAADIDRGFGSDEAMERLEAALPTTCPRCGAATWAPDPRMRGTTDRLAGTVRVVERCAGYEAVCEAALFADHEDDDVAAETCETPLAEAECPCRDCSYNDGEDR